MYNINKKRKEVFFMRKIIVFLQNTLGVFGSILYMLPAIYIIAGAPSMTRLPSFVGFISIIFIECRI